LINWCLKPTLAIFQPYNGDPNRENKYIIIIKKKTKWKGTEIGDNKTYMVSRNKRDILILGIGHEGKNFCVNYIHSYIYYSN
jgi:hypothetical protein